MSERLDAWHYQSMICVLVVSCDCVMILYLMLCFVVFLLDLKFVQIVLGTQLCFCFQKKIWLCQYRYFFVLDQLMYALFFFFLQKKSFYRKEKNPGNAFVIDLPLCPIHKCRSWFILFTLSSTIYVVSLVNSSLNLETAHIFLSSHHLAFSGRHVLYFKWVSINMKYQYWWYHTVMHLYWGSNKLNSRV